MDKILLSTAYFPPIEYFYFMLHAKTVEIEMHETYVKQSFRNRCQIYSPNGLQALTIPVHKTNGNHTTTSEIQISDHADWRTQHWRSLQTSYNSSAFFLYYKNEIWQLLQSTETNLLNYNSNILTFLINEIGLAGSIGLTQEYINIPEGYKDLRTSISPKHRPLKLNFPDYYQVYGDKHGFIKNLSILDLLFNEGPNTLNYLQSLSSI